MTIKPCLNHKYENIKPTNFDNQTLFMSTCCRSHSNLRKSQCHRVSTKSCRLAVKETVYRQPPQQSPITVKLPQVPKRRHLCYHQEQKSSLNAHHIIQVAWARNRHPINWYKNHHEKVQLHGIPWLRVHQAAMTLIALWTYAHKIQNCVTKDTVENDKCRPKECDRRSVL